MIKINQIAGLKRQARKEMLANHLSVNTIGMSGYGFEGYINGNSVVDGTLKRIEGKWFFNDNQILSIYGTLEFFIIHY